MKFYQPNEDLLNSAYSRASKDVTQKDQVSTPMFYIKPGSSQVRVLPPWSEKGVWFHEIKEHFIRTDNDYSLFTCPSTVGEFCPVCQEGMKYYKSSDPENVEFGKNLRPRTQVLYNVIVENAPTGVEFEYGKIYVMKTGVMVKRDLLDLDRDVTGGFANITDIENGVAVSIKRTGKGLSTSYYVRPTPKGRSNLKAELHEHGIDLDSLELYPLDQIFQPPSEEELKSLVNNGFIMPRRNSAFPGAMAIPMNTSMEINTDFTQSRNVEEVDDPIL